MPDHGASRYRDVQVFRPGRYWLTRFDATAEVVQQLTADRAAIEVAIGGLTSREGTYIDRALDVAGAELAGPRHRPDNLPVVALLTDGNQTGGSDAALVAAHRLREAGVQLYAIGLGTDVDGLTLAAMAGAAGRYRFAPDSTALAAIYGDVARDIQCPAEKLWPRAGP